MVSFTAITAGAIMAFTTALAAPTTPANKGLGVRSESGSITWFNPGLGACGETSADGDAIVAVSSAVFDSDNACGRNIRVNYNGQSVNVRVVDRCPSCDHGDLDLSPSAFESLTGDKGLGRVQGTWDWA
ncbi:rare lipoprotein A (RlpA)-like double-psi beta-barrel domain-containing protein [Purpureocillium lavendulum]|uniref:Rare lipoprotein A (RlpA)-like double-psi beta-barrel domain-containing protein n=1 Tax=Purpureocillium lavendulum TaxID=1247861 RepID=A0AB34FMU8_9HYPO|nr:rare lipoprotein A (RlpA)-like double-psi beta-barrel domain-containing protein [Purpureocillium lavendulum]